MMVSCESITARRDGEISAKSRHFIFSIESSCSHIFTAKNDLDGNFLKLCLAWS